LNDIVIVGSGASLINSNLGSKIDSFENVARFGGSEVHLQKYKTDVGEKTTHLFYNTSRDGCRILARYAEENPDFYSSLFLFIHFQKKSTGTYRQELPNVIKVLNKHGIKHELYWSPKYIKFGKHKKTGLSFPAELIKFNRGGRYKYKNKSKHITGGLSAITKLFHEYDKVYLCGFDSLLEETSRYYKRFYDHRHSNRPEAYFHSISKEAQLIHYLIDKYEKISILQGE